MSNPKTKTAVILAAGWGSRVQALGEEGEAISKPLIDLEGRPMVVRVIQTLHAAGIEHCVVVTGYMAEKVEEVVVKLNKVDGLKVETIFNPEWSTLANGVSLLAAEPLVNGDFILSMSDHVYDVETAKALNQAGAEGFGVRLCIDRKIDEVFDIDDATKVVTKGSEIVAIDKALADYNAIDIGVFYCTKDIFPALREARKTNEKNDCSLSDGMRILGEDGRFGFFDIGDALWQDVDTPETLDYAEKLLSQGKIKFL